VRSVSTLLNKLQDLNVILWHDGERVRYRAPSGVLTPELLAEVKLHKAELTDFLAVAREAAEHGAPQHIIECAAKGPTRLSFAQERLWFLHKLEEPEGSLAATYNVSAAIHLRGALDISALRRSIETISRRHRILRTKFVDSDDGAIQIVEDAIAILNIVDFTNISANKCKNSVQILLESETEYLFNLEAAPPVRFSLLKINKNEHIFCCVFHHLVMDGWSMGVLSRELVTLYDAFTNDEDAALPDLAIQYADYAAHQRRTLTPEAIAKDLTYWKDNLSEAPAYIDLPLDFQRPARQSYRGGIIRFSINNDITDALKKLARHCNASLFMLLLASYALLLARYSGQSQVLIGTPVANRDHPDVEPLIGPFSNYIPLRVNIEADPNFKMLVEHVRGITLKSFTHQNIPFEKIVEAVDTGHRLDRPPLFQVALVLQNMTAVPLSLSGLDVKKIDLARTSAKLDLSVLLEEDNGTIRGELEFCQDLFTQGTADRMTKHFISIIQAVIQKPDLPVSSISLLEEAERTKIMEDLSGARALSPVTGLIHEQFHAQVRRTPHARALVAGDTQLSYKELAQQASQLARYLISTGVEKGSRVAVCLPRTTDLIVALLAVIEAGGAYVPLDSTHPNQRLKSIMDDAGTTVLLTISDLAARLEPLCAVICVDTEADAIEEQETHPLQTKGSPSQLAYVIYTSGSTGRPKGVMVEHRSVCSLVHGLAKTVYSDEPVCIPVALTASVAFDASVQQIFGSLLLGHTLVLTDNDTRQDVHRLLDFYEQHHIKIADGTPSLLGLLLDAGLGRRPGLKLQHLLIGGEALPSRLVHQLHFQDTQARITVTNLYGPTECGVDTTARSVLPEETLTSEFVPIGKALSNARIYVLDTNLACTPPGIPGEIWIGGPCLARGYLGQTGQTAAAFRPDPWLSGERLYASGDQGRWTDNGELEFLGRSDTQIKVRGYRVDTAEIEAALRQHDAVRDALVLLTEPDTANARLVAHIIPEVPVPTVEHLRDHLAVTLPPYMQPSAFMLLDRFPVNANGKLDRSKLPTADEELELAQGTVYIKPRSEYEIALAAVWAAVLDRPLIGAEDRFFALGGDSIKALQVVSKLRQTGLRLEVRDLFLHQTLSTLAPLLSPMTEHRATAQTSVSEIDVPFGPAQAAFMHHHTVPPNHFHQAILLDPGETVCSRSLSQAISAVYDHHHALSANFIQSKGRWVQKYSAVDNAPELELVDLTQAGKADVSLQEHATAMMASTTLTHGPLFRVAVYQLASSERILMCAHHLLVDGVSWRILVEDLHTAYTQARSMLEISLPPVTDSYGSWASGMHTLSLNIPESERCYWNEIEALPCAAPLAPRPAKYQHLDRIEQRFSLSENVTKALLTNAHDAYGTRMNDLLLTSLGRAMGIWSGTPRWRVLLESHGREPLWPGADVSRTVGWFTASYPVVIDFEGINMLDIGRQIKAVKEMLRNIPQAGSSYEASRYLARDRSPEREPSDIAFNYLGQLGQDLHAGSWRWIDETPGMMISEDAPLLHALEIMSFVDANQLHFCIAHARTGFDKEKISSFMSGLRQAIIDVVTHTTQKISTTLTPSDIDHDGFKIDDLDRFVNNLENPSYSGKK
jgi:amino acid adenylation domain-containing protein/non-ribosomal peptide synthase protein (TIGR01720 family)